MKKSKKVAMSVLFFAALTFGVSTASASTVVTPDIIHGCVGAGPCMWR